MKNKIFATIFLILLILLIGTIQSQAKVITNDPSVESGGIVTINITSQELIDGYKISISSNDGLTFVSASGGTYASGQVVSGVNPAGMQNLAVYKFTAPEVSKDTTYKVTFLAEGVIPHGTEEKTSNTATATITVKAKEETPVIPVEPETPTEPEKPTTPEEPQTPTITEPTFTSVNEIAYATGSINVRESYSTSSKIIGRLQKGEEVTRTGKGSNGWSKVTYKGTIAYISSSLLTTTKPEEEKKSDNAYLKSLTIEGQELLPAFNKETTEYKMQVKNDVTELNIKAETEDEKASVSIQGNKELKEGENIVTISVNAEDNTIKIYEIKVTRLKKVALGLKSLIIKDTDISKTFKTDIYEYEIDIKDVEKLEIEAVATDETATIEILGNEDLQDGENIITIIVSSQDGEEKVTYQIKAKKVIAKIENETQATTKEVDTKIYFYIAIGAILLIALIIVIVYTIRNRNNVEYDFTDNYEDDEEFPEEFPGELPEKQEKIEEYNQKIEQTQEINYNDSEIQNDNMEEQNDEIQDKKANIDYFLDSEEDEEPKRRRGKHF